MTIKPSFFNFISVKKTTENRFKLKNKTSLNSNYYRMLKFDSFFVMHMLKLYMYTCTF